MFIHIRKKSFILYVKVNNAHSDIYVFLKEFSCHVLKRK